MVLGFSLRRKKTKEEPVAIRTSPSLPNISATGLSPSDWPEGWVDIGRIKQEIGSGSDEDHSGQQSPATVRKATFKSAGQVIAGFHRPFRPIQTGADQQVGGGLDSPHGRKSIASMYSSNAPPSAFNFSASFPILNKKPSLRRITRVPPKFNIMVAGGQGTGKTSFLKLFLNTCDISPAAAEEDITAVKKFTGDTIKRTKALRSVSVEVCEERHDRIQLTVIDTAGFDFQEGKELDLDRTVSSIVKYMDTQFAETMGEESKVIRQNKGDKHVHLCIYLVDPDTIVQPSVRRAKAGTGPYKFRSAPPTRRASLSSITSTSSDSSSEEEDEQESTAGRASPRLPKVKPDAECMAPNELQVLKRLAVRCNVLPVVARADTLTDDRLELVRRVIRRDIRNAGLGFGVFDPAPLPSEKDKGSAKVPQTPTRKVQIDSPQPPMTPDEEDEEDEEDDSEEERPSRPVIKLRSRPNPAGRERSRSRRRLLDLEDEDDVHPHPAANAAKYGGKASKSELTLPFAVISPEEPRKPKARAQKTTDQAPSTVNDDAQSQATHDDTRSSIRRRTSSVKAKIRTPDELKGQFVRKYRWGTIDVLDPAHCDFVTMRTAILGTHMRMLKNSTKEELYERYRTEKLLARRATQQISDADRNKLFNEIGV